MRRKRSEGNFIWRTLLWCLLISVCLLVTAGVSQAFTLKVVDQNGNPVKGFRWLVEEDTTYEVIPGAIVSDSPGVNIHKSYAPVVRTGHTVGAQAGVGVPATKRYAVTVLPDEGHALGGANVKAHQGSVTVIVQTYPIPTAQISVLAFHDNNPINNTPDQPFEEGLADFSLLVFDQFGQISQDAFGNPLGTTYNADGTVNVIGTGVIRTDANGQAFVKNIPPGKYGVRLVPPPDKANWVQTSTIEGTPGVDAWVKANEPPYFLEFGPTIQHVFTGFVEPQNIIPAGPGATVTGQLVRFHASRPPTILPANGVPVPQAIFGVNDLTLAGQKGIFVGAANPADGTFTVPSLPPGTYQIVSWDVNLDYIFNFFTVIVTDADVGTTINLGQVPVNAWFGTLKGSVFYDENENGIRDPGEVGLWNQVVDTRFRDGSLYQATLTDNNGEYEFAEVFPWFKWTVAEVNYTSMKATGATIQVDEGAALPGCLPGSEICPQPQPENAGLPYRVQLSTDPVTGVYNPVLLQAMTLYADQTNIIDWGKKNYAPGENGGIVGIAFYATTRAEDDPRLAAAETWEPGIPRVQVNLYQSDGAGNIVDLNADGKVTLADVDNYPFAWSQSGKKGPEDVKRAGAGAFNKGDAVRVTWTDSWDDNLPTGCVYTTPDQRPLVHGQQMIDCAETIRTWNQVRPGVFDGGYGFFGIPSGQYIVEIVPPAGYKIQKEEDKNVVFGDRYTPSPLLELPACVGTFANTRVHHKVPPYLTLFPDQQVPAYRAGEETPLCTMREVLLSDGQNTNADFFLFTDVPKSARAMGLMTNDLANQLNPDAPNFGEKLGPSWIPVSFQDYQGKEITRVYTDEFGIYNSLVPSTFTLNPPIPTGVSPNMITLCLNHPGPIPDPKHPGRFIVDPSYDKRYGQACLTLDFWPGKITYPDTPVVPIAAFTGAQNATLDCEFPNQTPVIYSVSGPGAGGPYVPNTGSVLTILSAGKTEVLNPDYNPWDPVLPRTIIRDYGFGAAAGTVTLGGVPLTGVQWSDGVIRATVPAGAAAGGQLVVTRKDSGRASTLGVTVTVGGPAPIRVANSNQSIQAAINASAPGGLVLVAPGTYKENVIMWQPVKLQGWGAASTIINASPYPAERIQAWSDYLATLVNSGTVDLVPGEDPTFIQERAPGIFVLTKEGAFSQALAARIDGFTIEGANAGGAIFANAYAHYLEISNNRLLSNMGVFGGGIRVGSQALVNATNNGYYSSQNDNIKIHNNHVSQNGGVLGGAGIALYTGTDNYQVTNNYICGNFTTNNGGGINHFGLSDGGLIANNVILMNEAFYGGGTGGEGGGIYVAGLPVPALAPVGTLSQGTGSVTINANLIQGNLAGAGDGGGIRASFVNGQDVQNLLQANWFKLNIFNNMIVNNVSGLAGGAIALQDVANANIINNTASNNDGTASGANAFAGGAAVSSTPLGAGIIARMHSAGLEAALAGQGVTQTFSNPVLYNNIVRHNRSFYWDGTAGAGTGALVANPTLPFWDLSVVGGAVTDLLNPQFSVLTDTTGYAVTNISTDPLFLSEYFNALQTAAVAQEGGNFVQVTFKPLTLAGNYHIYPATSPAIDQGSSLYLAQFTELQKDFDGNSRTGSVDIGADETDPNARALKILKAGTGSGTVTSSPAGIACGSSCIGIFNVGTKVTLTAAPVDTHTTFDGWSGDAVGTAKTVNVTMDANKTVTATFTGASITVTSPNGGETWTRGTPATITWNYTGAPTGNVKIQLYKNGQLNRQIGLAVPITKKTVTWRPPAGLPAGTDYRIKISTTDGLYTDTSDADFTIN